MAVTPITSGLEEVVGVKYTVRTDSSSDWGSVSNDVYFYDVATNLPYYKNASGDVVSIFEEGGSGGGNSITLSVQKDSGGTINKGQVVILADYDVVADLTTVELADNSSGTTMPGIGIATSSIAQATTGTIIIFGKATGLNTSALSLGDVYVGTSGGVTNTKPTGNAVVQRIGKVTRVSSTVGEIIVFGGGMDNVNSSTADYCRGSKVNGSLAATYVTADQIIPITVQSENSNTNKFTITGNGIRVNQAGRYRVNCMTSINSIGTQRADPVMKVTVNNTIAVDANNQEYRSLEHYARNAGSSNNSSSDLNLILDLAANDIVRIILSEGGVTTNTDTTILSSGTFLELSEMIAGESTPVTGSGTKVLVKGAMGANQTVNNTTPIVNFVTTGTPAGGALDVNGEWDNTNHKFTVGSSGAGTYLVQANIFLNNGSSWSHLFLYKNGLIYAPFAGFGTATSSWDNDDGTIPIDLVVGDYIDIRCYSSGNGTIDFNNQALRQSFSITKIGNNLTVNNVVLQTLNKTFTLQEPTATDDITVFRTDEAITIQEVIAVSTGGSPSTEYALKYSTDRSAAGTTLVSATTTTSTSTGDVASLTNANIPADSFIWIETGTVSGTAVYLSLDIRYTED
tara:strand:+ start:1711 stop:3588 length:1878 start_codon:yes stop_codon:yes gene_type:complete